MVLPDPAAAGPAYAGVRTRLTDLLRDADVTTAATVVPTCPAWTVQDVIAHLAGACEDVLAGNLEGVASPAWTSAQVQRLRGESLAGLLDLWRVVGPSVEAITSAFPPSAAAQLVFDAATHEQDVRTALGRPGGRDSESVAVACAFLLNALGGMIRARALPPLAVALDGEAPVVLGGTDVAVTLTATRYDVLRAFGGRRSLAQVRALAWTGDPEPYFSFFNDILSPPATDVVE